jgi:hypothetical protein
MGKLILILDDKKLSSIIRIFDLFEEYKFIGILVTKITKNNKFLKWKENDKFKISEQILNNEKYKIHTDYKDFLISDGYHFMKLEYFCNMQII